MGAWTVANLVTAVVAMCLGGIGPTSAQSNSDRRNQCEREIPSSMSPCVDKGSQSFSFLRWHAG